MQVQTHQEQQPCQSFSKIPQMQLSKGHEMDQNSYILQPKTLSTPLMELEELPTPGASQSAQ